MLIDWFTVGAQVVNFLILVWLLKRFLYKPILNAIDEREARIARELADADAAKAQARQERDEFEHKNQLFEQQRRTLMERATEEARAERKRLLDEARKDADTLSAQRQETLRLDAHNLNLAIRRRAQQEVFAIAHNALSDLAGERLETQMVEVFIRRLQKMDDEVKTVMGDALKTSSAPAQICSAFELPDGLRAALQDALNESFSAEIRLQFQVEPGQISGIELIANGRKLSWSISDYLSSLEKGVAELLKNKAVSVKTEPDIKAG